jgi:hypothetical protein
MCRIRAAPLRGTKYRRADLSGATQTGVKPPEQFGARGPGDATTSPGPSAVCNARLRDMLSATAYPAIWVPQGGLSPTSRSGCRSRPPRGQPHAAAAQIPGPTHARTFIDHLVKQRLPSMHQWPELAEDGLIGYGPRFTDVLRQRARLVVRVLRGAKPADIPVEQPTRFELVINLPERGDGRAQQRIIGVTFKACCGSRGRAHSGALTGRAWQTSGGKRP